MAQNLNVFDDIEWGIDSSPSCAYRKSSGASLTKQDLDIVIFPDETKINIRFMMNDSWDFSVTREMKGPFTIRSILKFIFKFYEEPMDRSLFDKIFGEKYKYRLEELLDDEERVGEMYIQNIHAFDDGCGLPFEGLEYNAEDNSYTVLIGPT